MEDKLLLCVSCKRRIHAESDKCPQCGKKDPFMYNKIEKKAVILMLLDAFLSFLIATKICSLINGKLYVLGILLWVLAAVFYKIGGYFIKLYIDGQVLKMKEEIKIIYNNSEEANEWRKAMTKRIYGLLKYC